MIMEISFCLYVILINQVFLIQADELCYYYNQSSLVPINCKQICCSGMPVSPGTACCSSYWNLLAIPVFIIIGICLIIVCLAYCRPLLKLCLCGYQCPYPNRSRVTSSDLMSENDNPVYIMNNGGLPDYKTVTKDIRRKDITPPPYNFVTAHPTDFGIETRIPSAPPQYRSRSNSLSTVRSPTPIES